MKWEYRRKVINLHLTIDTGIDEELRELGEDGWEVFAIVPVEGNARVLIAHAKRPLTVENLLERGKTKLLGTKKGFISHG